jgi:hypothetical protein
LTLAWYTLKSKSKAMWTRRVFYATIAVVVALSVAEAALRLILFSESLHCAPMENPGLYADPEAGDDYWVLCHYDSAAGMD